VNVIVDGALAQMLFIGGIIGRFRETFTDAFRQIHFAGVRLWTTN
jgi:hypothetical protein